MFLPFARILRPTPPSLSLADWAGFWVDEHGSRMELICCGNRVDGSYHTTFHPSKGRETFALTGFIQDALISFTVHFAGHGSLACWVGELGRDETDATILRTAWLLTERLKPGKGPATALSGNNEFRRLPVA